MKKLYTILLAVVAVLLLWLGWRWAAAPHVDKPSETFARKDPPTSIQNDPVKIFQRAFWASPTSDDKILHAERREWSGPDGVRKWQWFLVVEPSPALLKRLRDDNAFGLIPAAAASLPSDAPEWFAFNKDEVSVLKSPQGKLQLMFSKNKHTLYATDSGLGFRAGAAAPVRSAPPPPSSPAMPPGRLPSAHPPIPEPPAAAETPEPPAAAETPEPPAAAETPAPPAVREPPIAPAAPAAPEPAEPADSPALPNFPQ